MSNKPPDPVYVLRGAHHPISSINFLHTGSLTENTRYLASGSQEGIVSIWDLKVRGTKHHWTGHSSSVLWLKYPNPSDLWTCGRSESVILWDINQGAAMEKRKFPIQEYLGFSVCDIIDFNERKLLCVPGPSQESLTIWDVNSKTRICCLISENPKLLGSIMQCRWIVCGHSLTVLIAYENGTLALWDWVNKKILSTISINDNPVSLEFSQSLMKGICGTASEAIIVFSIQEDTATICSEKQFDITNPGIGCISSRPDGKIYAVGGWDHRLRLFTWNKHKPLAVLIYHKQSISCLSYSDGSVEGFGEGYLLAAGSCDNSISLWNIFN